MMPIERRVNPEQPLCQVLVSVSKIEGAPLYMTTLPPWTVTYFGVDRDNTLAPPYCLPFLEHEMGQWGETLCDLVILMNVLRYPMQETEWSSPINIIDIMIMRGANPRDVIVCGDKSLIDPFLRSTPITVGPHQYIFQYLTELQEPPSLQASINPDRQITALLEEIWNNNFQAPSPPSLSINSN